MGKNKILITQFIVGPTYKDRIKYNLNKYRESYKFFDVVILTDDVEYFADTSYDNVFFVDIDTLRASSPWSIQNEKFPQEKRSESLYAREFVMSAVKIPTLIRRFVFLLPGIEEYCGYIFMDADAIPIADEATYPVIENYFCHATTHPEYGGNISDRICVIPGIEDGYDVTHHGFLLEYANRINDKYKIRDVVNPSFMLTDGNFRTLRFGNKAQIIPFFELVNNTIMDIIRGEYSLLGIGIIWNMHSEYILAIAFNLMGAVGYPMTAGTGIHPQSCFRIDSYPEDRFWHSGIGFKMTDTRDEFIRLNYDDLRTFYTNRGQEWIY